MSKKQSGKSIDGFIPRKSGQRSIGFGQSAPSRQAIGFPDVGTTLPAYPRNLVGTRPVPASVPLTDEEKTGRFRRLKAKISWKRAVITLVIIMLVLVGWLGWKFIYNLSKIFRGNVFGILSTTQLKGEDVGRVNILLAGNSADDPGHDGANLTDSIMILSIDTKDNTAFMLSIPRDLWVDIPGFGHAKINEAYPDGENEHFNQSGYFNGGMGLLQEVVQQNFDITLNYYALINYNAFRDAVNAVGGVQVDIQSPDPRGLYDPNTDYVTQGPLVDLSNGKHTLNGEQALDLARARGDSYNSYGFPQSDFDRTQHQRQLLIALKDKVLSTGVLANPVKLSSLSDALGNNVKTNFTLSEVRRLYDLTKKIGNSAIKSLSLNNADGKNLLQSYTSDSGESALIPTAGVDDFTQIQLYMRKLTSHDPVIKESASVVVLNATDMYGLATKNSQTLTTKGLTVVDVADAPQNQATTTIIDNAKGKKPATKSYLESLYGKNTTTTNPYATKYTADFIVVLGADQVTQ
jgi:LCP family protein required for cell wall assembly